MQIIQQQYLLTQRSRDAMLNFVENSLGNQIVNPMPAFNNKSVRDLLVHNASCYLHWIDHFGFRRPKRSIKASDFATMTDIRTLYSQVDEVLNSFIDRFGANPHELISSELDGWGPGSATALDLFTHVMTHEFHHKGQILSMCRQLGHVPPDTDVSISF